MWLRVKFLELYGTGILPNGWDLCSEPDSGSWLQLFASSALVPAAWEMWVVFLNTGLSLVLPYLLQALESEPVDGRTLPFCFFLLSPSQNEKKKKVLMWELSAFSCRRWNKESVKWEKWHRHREEQHRRYYQVSKKKPPTLKMQGHQEWLSQWGETHFEKCNIGLFHQESQNVVFQNKGTRIPPGNVSTDQNAFL